MTGRGKGRNIAYIKQDEPAFLKQFKERIGYEEGPNVDSKREPREAADSDDEVQVDDEKPMVVVLRKGDLTAEEAEAELEKQGKSLGGDDEEEGEEEEVNIAGPLPKDGKADIPDRIMFKRPSKRSSSNNAKDDLNVTSSSKKKKDEEKKKSFAAKQSKVSSVNNKQLLSFGDDEEEEDE